MSSVRRQTHVAAPLEVVWELVGDPNRHPEWFPKVVEAECEGIEEGCSYRMVIKGPMGAAEEMALVESLEDCGEIKIRCESGTYMLFKLAGLREGTFIDVEFGMEPEALQHRVFDRLAGKRYYGRWLEQSVDALRQTAERTPAAT